MHLNINPVFDNARACILVLEYFHAIIIPPPSSGLFIDECPYIPIINPLSPVNGNFFILTSVILLINLLLIVWRSLYH